MGEKLKVKPGAEIVVSVVVRDPAGTNNAPYVFNNPSLAQIGTQQPINMPVLDHIDLIRGMVAAIARRVLRAIRVSGRATPRGCTPTAPRPTCQCSGAAKNTSAAVIKTFSSASTWTPFTADGWDHVPEDDLRVPAVSASQYVRLRGTNMPAAVPYETDASGNPLADIYTNANNTEMLRIPCTTTGTHVPTGTPTTRHVTSMVARRIWRWLRARARSLARRPCPSTSRRGRLWFYSNPIYVEVTGGQVVAGVQ